MKTKPIHLTAIGEMTSRELMCDNVYMNDSRRPEGVDNIDWMKKQANIHFVQTQKSTWPDIDMTETVTVKIPQFKRKNRFPNSTFQKKDDVTDKDKTALRNFTLIENGTDDDETYESYPSEVECIAVYCDSVSWDYNWETMDRSGNGSKAHPFRNVMYALIEIQHALYVHAHTPYFCLFLSGVIDYPITAAFNTHYTDKRGSNSPIEKIHYSSWDGSDVTYFMSSLQTTDFFRHLIITGEHNADGYATVKLDYKHLPDKENGDLNNGLEDREEWFLKYSNWIDILNPMDCDSLDPIEFGVAVPDALLMRNIKFVPGDVSKARNLEGCHFSLPKITQNCIVDLSGMPEGGTGKNRWGDCLTSYPGAANGWGYEQDIYPVSVDDGEHYIIDCEFNVGNHVYCDRSDKERGFPYLQEPFIMFSNWFNCKITGASQLCGIVENCEVTLDTKFAVHELEPYSGYLGHCLFVDSKVTMSDSTGEISFPTIYGIVNSQINISANEGIYVEFKYGGGIWLDSSITGLPVRYPEDDDHPIFNCNFTKYEKS